MSVDTITDLRRLQMANNSPEQTPGVCPISVESRVPPLLSQHQLGQQLDSTQLLLENSFTTHGQKGSCTLLHTGQLLPPNKDPSGVTNMEQYSQTDTLSYVKQRTVFFSGYKAHLKSFNFLRLSNTPCVLILVVLTERFYVVHDAQKILHNVLVRLWSA